MYIVSISHKTAPVEIRERFSFTKEEQSEFLNRILQNEHITEGVIVSTCNRSEVYFNGDNQAVRTIEQYLAKYKQVDLDILMKYYLVYSGEAAIRHLFYVTCGMDSMLIGEDEILGQIKEAYERALGLGTTKYMLNTLFQAAITCAKKIKTNTKISKTPLSVGTLVANKILNFPGKEKKVLIIGLTGKMGTIIWKNIHGKQKIEIIGTTRSHNAIEQCRIEYEDIKVINYKDRYKFVDAADIIISATTSPHYTITYHELLENIKEEKERIFIDLSVPMDIDKDIMKIKKLSLYDIDYFQTVAQNNNEVKGKEIEGAKLKIEEQMDEVLKMLYFHDFLAYMHKVKQVFEEKTFESIMYELRDNADSAELTVLLNTFRKLI